MKKWIALCDNYGWQGRYIHKDEVVENPTKPNEYFAEVKQPKAPAVPEE